MRIIFLQDVPGKGSIGEIKEVADGYARNYLLPKGLGLLATASAVQVAEKHREQQRRQETRTEAELAELARMIEGTEIILKARVGVKEHLFGSITSTNIAEELGRTTGFAIDKKKVELKEPIRQLGTHEVSIRLSQNLYPRIKVNVEEA